MRHYSLIRDTQRGMTLVELIVAMLILGFAVSAFLPLQAVVAKNIKTIQQKQQARQLANRIMEDLVFSTTAANYNTSADLAIGRNVVVIDGFTVEKVISWVDDPADGTFDDSVSPNPDPVPFDYKSISITVKAPNPFSGRLYTAAVLNSNLAREGPGDPFNGVIVKVNRIYDSGAPVAGALVTLSSSSGADSYTGITDEKGQVILAVNFPSAPPDDFEYTVNVSKSGWMLDPKPSHGNKITLNRWATKTIQMEMEIPQNIVLTFNQAHLGGQVTITRVVDNYIYSIENIPDHATSYNFTTSVYPSGTYKIDVELTAWQEDFETSKGDFVLWEGYNAGPPIQDNAWKWSAGYWQARPSTLGCLANDPGKNRLGKTIDLLPIKNIDLDWDTTIPAKL
ncbi:MAG: prepilin-type N-terminal cleavage/methylation domain-containing protein, partial [Deltaproteobacteria bacterium]